MTPPTRYALVPERLTPEMHMALFAKVSSTDGDGRWIHPDAGYQAALAASPNAGCVTAEMLERAASAYLMDLEGFSLAGCQPGWRQHYLNAMRAALTAIGLQVDAPAGCKQEVADG